ncbi:hypothetical protein KUTeg_010783 [Tegillarca granosa]|uniref:Uncharacterized protein n=1 Tax=Tegillarca granosa TaxID=220873 RepID=A0ABQ9F746_TEGGR|nr:hypothetical protein KUTeg_010783 [Tegillarca granosa]
MIMMIRACIVFISKELINGELQPCDLVREELVYPYRQVQTTLSLNKKGINKLDLNEVIEHFFERFDCVGGYVSECNNTQCLDAEDVYKSLKINNTGVLSEVDFGKASTILLSQLLDLPTNCSRIITLNQDYQAYKDILMSRVFKGNEIESGPLQDFLEKLYTYIKKDSDGNHDDHDHSQTENMDDHDGHDHEEMPATIKAKCVSGKTIFEQAGYDPSSTIEEDCRLLPRKSDFIHTLMDGLGAVNDSLSHTDFEQLLSKLNLKNHTVGAEQPVETTDHSGHGHRRRRDIGQHKLRRVSRDTADHHDTDHHSSPSVDTATVL